MAHVLSRPRGTVLLMTMILLTISVGALLAVFTASSNNVVQTDRHIEREQAFYTSQSINSG